MSAQTQSGQTATSTTMLRTVAASVLLLMAIVGLLASNSLDWIEVSGPAATGSFDETNGLDFDAVATATEAAEVEGSETSPLVEIWFDIGLWVSIVVVVAAVGIAASVAPARFVGLALVAAAAGSALAATLTAKGDIEEHLRRFLIGPDDSVTGVVTSTGPGIIVACIAFGLAAAAVLAMPAFAGGRTPPPAAAPPTAGQDALP